MQMTSFTIKKATAIYRLISSFLILSFLSSSFAAEDLVGFCFERSVNLSQAQQSMSFLLLPHEKVFPRAADHCFDVLTSTDRSKLLEKFLSRRYNLIAETGVSAASSDLQDMQCRLELTTTRIRKEEVKGFRAGAGLMAAAGTKDVKEVSSSELLLAFGRPGTLDLEGRSLQVECTKGASGVYQLTFSFSEQYRSRVSSSVSLKQGETLQVAQVTKDLASQSKTLGLPQAHYEDIQGKENISYELRIK